MTAGSFPAVSSFQALFRPTGQHGVSVLPAGKLKKQAIAKAITRCLRYGRISRRNDPDDLPVPAVLWSDHRLDGYTDLWRSESVRQFAGHGVKGIDYGRDQYQAGCF